MCEIRQVRDGSLFAVHDVTRERLLCDPKADVAADSKQRPFMADSGHQAERPEWRVMAMSSGAHHRLATPEPPPGADIRERASALLDFRRLYPQVRTLRMAVPIVRR